MDHELLQSIKMLEDVKEQKGKNDILPLACLF